MIFSDCKINTHQNFISSTSFHRMICVNVCNLQPSYRQCLKSEIHVQCTTCMYLNTCIDFQYAGMRIPYANTVCEYPK